MPAYDPRAVRDRLILEALAYAAHGLLFGFGFLPSRHRPKRDKTIRTLVLVHGLGATRASFFPMQGFLSLLGHSRQLSFNYRAGEGIEASAVALAGRLRREVRGGRIDLVGHSLGGLVARSYVQLLGGDRRVDHLVTIGTPHRGTHASVYVPTRAMWDLRPGSDLIQKLDALPAPKAHCLSIALRRDLMVLPAEHSHPPFGEHVDFDDLGHLDALLSPRVFETVDRFLRLAADPA